MEWLYGYAIIGALVGLVACFVPQARYSSGLVFTLVIVTVIVLWPVVLVGGYLKTRTLDNDDA